MSAPTLARPGTLCLVPDGLTARDAEVLLQDEAVRRENEEILRRYLSAVRLRWRPNTVRVREIQLGRFARWLYPTPLTEASEDQVVDFHAQLDLSAEGVNGYVSALRGFYGWLSVRARPKVRSDDPTELLERPRVPRRAPRPVLARDYQLALACAMSDPVMYAWLGLMGCSGLRCCEVAWLRSSDVEERADGTGLLHVTGKGGHVRTVPAGTDLMTVLRPFLEARPTGHVFARPLDGGPHTPDRVSQLVAKFLRGIGVQATAHQLRHRFGTDYHEIDQDVFRQAELMGHASVEMTRRYSAVSASAASRYVEHLTRSQLAGTAGRVAVRKPADRHGRAERSGRREGRSQ
ncbi:MULTISPECIES: tyrosine-type recombinase/integrase [unclassified Pseudonocardia]|uniref:tyrosine-type recombinase/integrase n=1 Tax=unclassified Pseudonocardia TaxID=2619320 RepID=UPI0001FFE2B9|nr:tyrosine-type recombinase/integrase [Pseudonocardia sp. Ae707_Ps1]OLM20864.1 Tyrosine recombinase XerD [Pseudonocardia sp. Ae707_Ps1]